MIDINLIRKTPDVVRENIKKKFQDSKLPLVDEVIELDRKNREAMQQADSLRNQRKVLSKEIGGLMKQERRMRPRRPRRRSTRWPTSWRIWNSWKRNMPPRSRSACRSSRRSSIPSVPIGKDDSENVEIERFGEPFVPGF